MSIKFSQVQINERVKFENPWWETNEIEPYFSKMKKREYFNLFVPLVNEKTIKRAVVLMGPRRVGKTVLLFHTVQMLIDQGIDPKNICYFSIETPIYNGIALEELLNIYIALVKGNTHKEIYLIFDEIQYLKDWEIHLKSLVDSYHSIKFIVSGSAAAALKLKSNESGAGRFTDFILPPLTFHEYLVLTGKNGIINPKRQAADLNYITNSIHKLNEYFIDYINYGGYPEVSLSATIQADPGRYVRSDIIDKVLLRDLPSLYGIQDIQELNSLFTYIAYNSGAEMSLDGIAQNSGVAKNTIKKYITYLEAAFLINVIHRIDDSAKKFKRANFFKIYLTNPSLRSALFAPLTNTDTHIGNMVETAIFSQWQHANHSLHYARWNNGEVDIVSLDGGLKPSWCVEIKWSNRFAENPHELKNIKWFCSKHKLEEDVVITTIDITQDKVIEGINYHFEPASLYCYNVGRNLVEGKNREFPI